MEEERQAFLDGEPTDLRRRFDFKFNQFIKSFTITMLSLILIVAGIGGVFVVRITGGIPTAPEIPSITALPPISRPQHDPNTNQDEGYTDDNPDFMSGFELTAPERFTDEDRKENFFTFLIVGLNEGTNANTVMVASIDTNSGETHVISIPRDSLLNVTRNNRKLSASYMVGAGGNRGRAGGVANVQREVRGVIGFMPDFYIIIDYDAFFAVIDVIGGVEVYVPFHMRYDDPLQDLHIDIQPGLQLMDSKTALHFARFRRANTGFTGISDYERIKNQQTVIDAVIASIISPRNLLRTTEFVRVFDNSVYSNLERLHMSWFLLQFNAFSPQAFRESVQFHTTPMLGTTGSPFYYERLNANGIVELVNRTVNPFDRPILRSDLNIITEIPE